jgi:exodeoxyribonuclease VII small subunit
MHSSEHAPASIQHQDDPALALMTFEQLLEELERVTRQIESREIGIEAATDLYERAGQLHAAASMRLTSVEARIAAIDGARLGAAAEID